MLASQITWAIDFSGEALLGSLQSLQAETEEATVNEVPLLISTYNPEAASETTPPCADPDLDSLEYGLDENLPAFQREDQETVQLVTLIGEILTGLGATSLFVR